MTNLLIATPILSDAGSYTDPGTTGTGVANLSSMQPGEAFLISGNSGHFHLDLGSAQAIDLFMAIHKDTTTALTWRIRGATSEANLTAGPGYDSGVISVYATGSRPTNYAASEPLTAVKYLTSAQTFRWWRIDFNDTGATNYSIGRVYFSKAWIPAINISFPWDEGFIDMAIRSRAQGAQTFAKNMGRLRVINFNLDFESESDMYTNAHEIDRLRGAAKDVLVVRDAAATTHLHQQTIYGLMTDLRPIVNTNFDIYSKPYRVEELTV